MAALEGRKVEQIKTYKWALSDSLTASYEEKSRYNRFVISMHR